MSEGKSQLGVTRREFYSTAATVFMFIGLVGVVAARADDTWRFIPAMLIAFLAIACSFLYTFMALRQKSQEGS